MTAAFNPELEVEMEVEGEDISKIPI